MGSVVEVGYNGVYQTDGLSVGYGDPVDVFNDKCGILFLGDELCKEYVRKISFLQDQIQEIFNRL